MATQNEQLSKATKEDQVAFIGYLSSEITSASTGIMLFRNRISFSVLVGPFLLLGSIMVSAKGRHIEWDCALGGFGVAGAIAGLTASFIGLAVLGGSVEYHTWTVVNRWRSLIAKFQAGNHVSESDMQDALVDEPTTRRVKELYVKAFVLMLVGFLATAYIALGVVRFTE